MYAFLLFAHYVLANTGGNFKWPYLREGSSDPLHVWFYGGVFEVGGSNGAISGFAKSKTWKIQMAISQRRIVRFTLFGSRMGFSGSADRMALFLICQIQLVCGRKQCARSN